MAHLTDINTIKEVLRYVMVLIGLRSQNWPNETEKAVLIDYIIRNYGGHTASEIKLAFMMAIDGKIGVEVNCYENFSVLYFAGIMNAYREWAREAYKLVEKRTPPEQKLLDAPKVTDEEFIQGVFTAYQVNEDFRLIPVLAYTVLEKELNLSKADKKAIAEKVKAIAKEKYSAELCKLYAVKLRFDKLLNHE